MELPIEDKVLIRFQSLYASIGVLAMTLLRGEPEKLDNLLDGLEALKSRSLSQKELFKFSPNNETKTAAKAEVSSSFDELIDMLKALRVDKE